MRIDATGTVVTFYSYKGGVGRTFALANTAAVLARWGYRTLCIDWDLDAPGLMPYFWKRDVGRRWSAPLTRGVIDLVEDHAAGRDPDPTAYAVPVPLPGATAALDIIPAGFGAGFAAVDGEEAKAAADRYVVRAQQLDWSALYTGHDLGGFLERCRAAWTATYDVVLVDSRTGITDIGGICTAQLPDVLVMLLTANDQSLEGTRSVALRAWQAHDRLPHGRGGLQIVPVLSRFDSREEKDRAERWQARFARDLVAEQVEPWASREIPVPLLSAHLTVPYVPYWSFGEELPAVVESDPTPNAISYALETLAALVAHRLDRTGLLAENRDSFVAAAARAGRSGSGADVFFSVSGRDRELAQRIADGLRARSMQVFLPGPDVAYRDPSGPVVDDALATAAHLVVLLGSDGAPAQQTREVERFLRQSLDEGTDRRVIPVLAPGARPHSLPAPLTQLSTVRLLDDGDDAVAVAVALIARDLSGPAADSGDVRADALDTLADVTSWELDPLRWQLVGAEVGSVEQALDADDDTALRAATNDLEVLGPVRQAKRDNAAEMPRELRDRVTGLILRLGGQLDVATAREAVTARLGRFTDGHTDAVLQRAALAEADRYRLAAGDDDLEAAYLLGLLHHFRARLRAERGEDGAADRDDAVRFYARVFPHAPDRVPPALRDDVAAAVGDVAPEVRAAWADRVTELIGEGRTTAGPAALDDAVWLARLAADGADSAEEQAGHRANLALALRARFRLMGDRADLDQAETVARAARQTSMSAPASTALALTLVDRYEATGRTENLDDAVAEFEIALDTGTLADSRRAGSLSNLASALATRFLARGDVADLVRAIDLLHDALYAARDGRERAGYAANLGSALFTRYRHLGDSRDLDEAVDLGRAAVAGLPETDPDRVAALSGLGLALRTRFPRSGDRADLDEAVAVLEAALTRSGDGPARTGVTSNLSTALRVRAEVNGDPADADRAVDLARAAVEGSRPGDARRTRYLSNLAAALSARHRASGERDDLDRSVEVGREAAGRLGPHDPLGATVRANLGLALRQRFGVTDDGSDLAAAAEAYRAAAEVVTAAPLPRALAAREWADTAADLGDTDAGLSGYTLALDLLAQVTDRRLAPDDQQHGLARLGGLASAAAAAALDSRQPELALTLLEQGRGVLLTQALETRGETHALRAADPELADRFERLRRRVNDPSSQDRRRLAREWADLLDEIRTRPGFERFLLAPSAAELIEAVGEGPLVAVNVTGHRCDALVVAAGAVTAVPLPDLTYADAHTRAAAFLAAVHGDEPDRDATVAATLAWLWDTVAVPVLAHLGTPPPRIWWMPTGPLGVLPLGAAGRGSKSLPDTTVSSTTPTIRALAHARRPGPAADRRTLVVAVPRPGTPDLPKLPAVEAEAAEVAGLVPDTDLLVGAEATAGNVRTALPTHPNGHFACHAVVDLADPSRSGLVLADGILSVRDIQAVEHPDANLAYLSACSTAFGGATLLDEAVHVAAAFQVAGYRHVAATMWPVGDLAARRFARLTYEALRDGADPAEAVHQAVTRTRAALPARPSAWAAHVHFGP